MKESFQALISHKDLKQEDQEIILKWKLWLAELQFDFKEVLRIIKILKSKDQSEEHLLNLARLAELTDQSPIPYYKIFVEKFPSSQSLLAVLISIIEKSSNKNKEIYLKKYASLFKGDSNKLTYLILKIDGGRLDEEFIKFFMPFPFMKDSPIVSFLQRKKVIEYFEKDLNKIKNYSLSKKISGYKLTKALKNYTNQIEQLGSKANEGLKTQDWTARVFIVSNWKKELHRFYNSVIELPLPKGLTEEEKSQYTKLLKEQMQIYKEQITQLQNELDTLWSRIF